jgi:hypothetical protein
MLHHAEGGGFGCGLFQTRVFLDRVFELDVLGELPETVPADSSLVSSSRCSGFRRDIVYGFWITSVNFFLPSDVLALEVFFELADLRFVGVE